MNPFQANFPYVKKLAGWILQAKCVKKNTYERVTF